ncbi:MAG: hypothetical protein HY758_11090, partial [Nitrospirae bacterium]|nr:hypothetical protein [Nitrospirota bacterium]
MMQLIVSSIPESGIEKEFRLPIRVEDIGLKGDVRVFLKAVKFDSTVLVDGKVWS